ncbi:MAG TPA: universal stress protein [Sphingobacteriaceae bacterium]|nr:universal stress protein [Sphingobacteriaceae bacterium]
MTSGKTDESILVCVYYGPNGERLIRRGCQLARMLNCPLYVLTVEPQAEEDLDLEKVQSLSRLRQIAEEHGAREYIIKYNEQRPVAHVIHEVVKEKNITQIVIGQTAQSRWKEITKGSFVNVLLHEVPFVDIHIVAIPREMETENGAFEKGVRGYLVKDEKGYRLSFRGGPGKVYEGVFYKELGTDFNNGIFRLVRNDEEMEVRIVDGQVGEKDLELLMK